jgi:ABC-type transport system involved in multi-copper enzyme maturation permease subunit
MKNRIATIARYTVLEAVRTRLPLLTLVTVGVFFAASLFVREIAITESARFQTAFYAGSIRLAIVFVAALYAIASIAREFQDKGLDVALALDLPRSHYIMGKLAGFLAIGAALATAASLPLVALSGWEAAAFWGISFALELAVVLALSVFCVVTFNQLMPAASLVLAFYLLARALSAIRLISANPVADAQTLSHHVMRALVEGIALIVPALDQWTRTAWLVGSAALGWTTLLDIGLHTILVVTILAAAAVFDMHRRNF